MGRWGGGREGWRDWREGEKGTESDGWRERRETGKTEGDKERRSGEGGEMGRERDGEIGLDEQTKGDSWRG
jgi:hypothetical protein